MDISTISRSTRGKFADTPYGIFELKYFLAISNPIPLLAPVTKTFFIKLFIQSQCFLKIRNQNMI